MQQHKGFLVDPPQAAVSAELVVGAFLPAPKWDWARHCIHGDWDAVAVGQTPSQGLQGVNYAVWNSFIFPHFLEEVCGEQ